jgi:hypothetical protein
MSDRQTARWIGLILLSQLVIAPLVNFGVLGPVFSAPGGFLVNAAPHATGLAITVVVDLLVGFLSVSIAVLLWPVLRVHGERLALFLLVCSTANLALNAVENATVMSLLSLSKAHAAAPVADAALYEALRGVVGAARNWMHYIKLFCGGVGLFVLYGALYRARLVPRALAGFGMLASITQMTSVALPLFGTPVVFALLAPLGLAQLALAAWLLTKGLADTPRA